MLIYKPYRKKFKLQENHERLGFQVPEFPTMKAPGKPHIVRNSVSTRISTAKALQELYNEIASVNLSKVRSFVDKLLTLVRNTTNQIHTMKPLQKHYNEINSSSLQRNHFS